MSRDSTLPRLLPTLGQRHHALASSDEQLRRLRAAPLAQTFAEAAARAGHSPLRAAGIRVVQMNLGKRCNQTCRHCHVDAGPSRREVMSDAVVEACLAFIRQYGVPVVDLTGGAPELHPHFRQIVRSAKALGCHVMDRCNLTVTRLPNYADLPEFFAEHRVEVVASLPWYTSNRTDVQRGGGVFDESIAAIRRLNELGYGMEGTQLDLVLVTNPVGAYLPPNQQALERDWKRELQRRYGVRFNRLYTITNMPISRFLEYLEESHQFESYLARLVNAFNPATVSGLMCRTTLSVGWDGKLYDCDFNQMLDLALPQTIFDDLAGLGGRTVHVDTHCFGCAAGGGSSCGGTLAE